MKQVFDSVKKGAMQGAAHGAKIGGSLSASSAALLGVMAYFGLLSNTYSRKSEWPYQMVEGLVMMLAFAPIAMVITGSVIGACRAIPVSLYAPLKNAKRESILPLHLSEPKLHHRATMMGV